MSVKGEELLVCAMGSCGQGKGEQYCGCDERDEVGIDGYDRRGECDM